VAWPGSEIDRSGLATVNRIRWGCKRTGETGRQNRLSGLLFQRDSQQRRLLFPAGGLLGGGGFFLLVSAAGLGVLLRGFLLVRFRGFISHNICFFLRLTRRRHESFSAGTAILPAGPVNVNDGSIATNARGLRNFAFDFAADPGY
jgi:hypothetical protein